MTRYSPLATPAATRTYLETWGLYTKKSLGQHFLIDDGVVGRILACADVKEGDSIIEIGPGIGTLTIALLAHGATVCAIEKDINLLKPLANLFEQEKGFSLIAADALDRGKVVKDLPFLAKTPIKLVANLPYAVAATIVLDYFEHFTALSSATVMVQKEVAERMMAQPGTKNYGAYTVKLRMLASPKSSFSVSRTSFLPPPRVDSTVIRLERYAVIPKGKEASSSGVSANGQPCKNGQPGTRFIMTPELYHATSFIVDAAFAQRRKTIRNSMRAYFLEHNRDADLVDELLIQGCINPACRGETLDLESFLTLGNLFIVQKIN